MATTRTSSQRFSRERPSVELTVHEAYGGTLWRDLRDGRLDALVAPSGHASPDLRSLELGSEPWVVLIGTGHPLAGIGPVAVGDLTGEAIAVTGHRDGASLDRAGRIEVLPDVTLYPWECSPERFIPGACLRSSSWCVTKCRAPRWPPSSS